MGEEHRRARRGTWKGEERGTEGRGKEHAGDGRGARRARDGAQRGWEWPAPGTSPVAPAWPQPRSPRVFLCRSDCEPEARQLCRVSGNSPAPTAPQPWAWALSSLEQTFTAWLGLVSIRLEALGKQSQSAGESRAGGQLFSTVPNTVGQGQGTKSCLHQSTAGTACHPQRRSECAGRCGGVWAGVFRPPFQLLLGGDLECQVPPSHTRGSRHQPLGPTEDGHPPAVGARAG